MITRLEVDGYRLLDGFAAELGDLTVVIGANAVGKSTLLDCLQCVSQCAELSLNTAIGLHWGAVSLLNVAASDQKVGWKITVQKPSLARWDPLPLERDRPLVYEVALRTDMAGQVSAQYEALRNLDPAPGHADPLKFLEATPFRRMIYDRKSHRLIGFDEALPKSDTPVVREATDGVSRLLGVPPAGVQESALLLSQIRFFNEFPVPSSVRFLLANMAFYPGFDITRFSNLRTKAAEIRAMATLLPNGENLGTVLHEVLTRYEFRPAAGELREFLRAAYPSFEEVHCDTTLGTPPQVLVRLREKGMGRSMELWELSDGMLRFLCLAAALLNPMTPPLVAIDEPELGLHPKLLPIVADMIKTASERTQVLVTTHSPDLLNRFDIEDVAVTARMEDAPRATWHRPADRPTLVQMLQSVAGETIGDLHRSGELETGA